MFYLERDSTMTDVLEQKRQLRYELMRARDGWSKHDLTKASTSIWYHAKNELDSWRERKSSKKLNIFSYLPFRSEVNTWPLFEYGWSKGDTLLSPKILSTNAPQMQLHVVENIHDIGKGKWGIPEPLDYCKIWSCDRWLQLDLVIVPGLGFDRYGGRIGYGGGWYDRFYKQVKQMVSSSATDTHFPLMAAPVLPVQWVGHVPMSAHDFHLQLFFTVDGIVSTYT